MMSKSSTDPSSPSRRDAEAARLPSPCLPRWLPAVTVIYLALPVVIFLAGWLRWPWALPAVTVALVAAWPLGRPCRSAPANPCAWPWWQAGVFLGAVALLVSTQGAGGLGVQNWDWIKHNAILKDLIERQWPVVYDQMKQPVALIYYVAYYLPASLVGKAFGWEAANIAIYLWTIAGCFLAGLWLWSLSDGRWWLVLACLLFFSGWDLVGDALWKPTQWRNNFDGEWWNSLWTLPSNFTLIAYAPHHAIPGWLFTALLISSLERVNKVPPLGGIFALSLLWSPFVTVGLGLLYLFWNGVSRRRWTEGIRQLWCPANLAAALLLAVLVMYFQSRSAPVRFPPSLTSEPQVVQRGELYITPIERGFAKFLPAYTGTLLLEFGLLAVLILLALPRQASQERRWVYVAGGTLVLLPWIHYGAYNDLVMRVCIPPLFVLQLIALRTLTSCASTPPAGRQSAWSPALLVVLAVGALYPLNMLRITGQRFAERSWDWVYIPPAAEVPDLFKQQRQTREQLFFIGQYVGSVRSPFFTHLAKPVPEKTPKKADAPRSSPQP